jgi:NADP-dependent 3-hydroxy acid dehydrogenase YdfG
MSSSLLIDRTAVVTGATSGIGRMVAARLVECGVQVCIVGRSAAKLALTRDELAKSTATVHTRCCDLDKDDDVVTLGSDIEHLFGGRLDLLIHCAGFLAIAPLESVPLADFDAHYRINVRAPLLLTQTLLPLLKAAHGQIVFVNSSLGTRIKEGAGAYAASKHALKAVADTLRAEVEKSGVRVLSAFPGNTATTMQQQACREFGKPYRPENMLHPEDVATAVVNALTLPANAALTELHILPARKT